MLKNLFVHWVYFIMYFVYIHVFVDIPPPAHRQFGWWCVVMMHGWTIPCLLLSGNPRVWPRGPSPTWRVGKGVCGISVTWYLLHVTRNAWGLEGGLGVWHSSSPWWRVGERELKGQICIVSPFCEEWIRGGVWHGTSPTSLVLTRLQKAENIW